MQTFSLMLCVLFSFCFYSYNFKLEDGAEVKPHIPLLNNRIYDTKFESQFYMISDSNKVHFYCYCRSLRKNPLANKSGQLCFISYEVEPTFYMCNTLGRGQNFHSAILKCILNKHILSSCANYADMSHQL